MTIDITIAFDYETQHWTHIYKVEKGSTVLDLKDKILQKDKHDKSDVDSFELRLRGQRVSDAEEIHQEHTLYFEYLGVEEGTKRAKEDEMDRKKREQDRTNAAKRKTQAQAPKPVAKAPTPVQVTDVSVLVKHAAPDMKSEVSVQVPSDATIIQLRRAVLAVLGESKLSEVKIVKKQGQSFQSLDDADKIGSSREFLSMGRKLDLPSGPLTILVTIDEELEFKSEIQVPRGSTVATLKQEIAAQDPTGATDPATFGIGIVKPSGKPVAIPDDTVLTAQHLQLQVVDPYVALTRAELPKPVPDIPGVPIWKVVGGSDKGGILVRSGQDTKSDQLPERLTTGSVVEQLQLVGERLHYRTLSGHGPEEGWVSLTVGGKDLVKKHPPHGIDAFTLERAIAMQTELRDAFASAEFQGHKQTIKEESTKKGEETVKRMDLVYVYQQPVLARYGFEGSRKGVQVMMGAYAPHMGSSITQKLNEEINELLA